MAKNSNIEWTNHTANLWWGCTKVHEGCDNCYAEVLSKRFGDNVWGNDHPRREIKSVWNDLKKYQTAAEKAGEIHKVFVGSMMDIFEKPMPLVNSKGEKLIYKTDLLRSKLFEEVIPQSPNLLFLLLTKRPSNINKYIPEKWKHIQYKNVMFGTSPVNQETFKTLTSQLQEVKGRKFLSIEPQLDKIELGNLKDVEWIIQGGESGHHKRPFDISWARSMKEECKELGVPYFFKQIDKIQDIPKDLQIRQFPK